MTTGTAPASAMPEASVTAHSSAMPTSNTLSGYARAYEASDVPSIIAAVIATMRRSSRASRMSACEKTDEYDGAQPCFL